MGDLVKRVMAWRWVAHLMRAIERFNSRLGNQFSAAITYFSVLAIVPILMFAFAILGLTVEVIRPDLAQTLTNAIAARLDGAGGAKDIAGSVIGTLKNWRGVGAVALISAAYAGTGWVGNIRQAINAMWHPDSINPAGPKGIGGWLRSLGRNLLTLVGLIVLGGITVVVSMSATWAQSLVLGWLGLRGSGVAAFLTVIAALLVSLLSGWALFVYLYWVLPSERVSIHSIARGALLGSFGLAALQYFAGALNALFLQNKAAAIFGPAIVIMLSLNIFATLVMLGAAWTATTSAEPKPVVAAPRDARPTMIPLAEHPDFQGALYVPQKVAKRGVTAGIVAGYALGGAAGMGLGAVLGRLAGAVAHRRRRRL
ncbi:MAG TPA: YhjD/YihY/BrkB family envelope integrity protein [Propionibacteriaceae bacterium]|nr:YhjD/YihY/BrkB family envelope integrity protein [Propionibacteriaceae bacterium]